MSCDPASEWLTCPWIEQAPIKPRTRDGQDARPEPHIEDKPPTQRTGRGSEETSETRSGRHQFGVEAKQADAVFKIAFALRSSRFSRSRSTRRRRSSLERPGLVPASIWACLTQPCDVSRLMPKLVTDSATRPGHRQLQVRIHKQILDQTDRPVAKLVWVHAWCWHARWPSGVKNTVLMRPLPARLHGSARVNGGSSPWFLQVRDAETTVPCAIAHSVSRSPSIA